MKEYLSYDRTEDFQEFSAKEHFKCLLNTVGMPIQINGKDALGVITNEFNPYSEDKEERKIRVAKEEPLERGDSILFDEEPYLVVTDIDKQYANKKYIYKDAKISKCDQLLISNQFLKPIPCILSNFGYGVKTNYNNDFLSDADSKVTISLWKSDEVRKIKRDQRYMFSNSEYMIFKVIDIIFLKKNKCELICKKDKYMHGLDDLENNLAYNGDITPPPEVVSNIEGVEKIKINTIEKYKIITNASIKWEIDGLDALQGGIAKKITIPNEPLNECSIKGLMLNEMFILSAIDTQTNKTLASKTIYVVK